LPTKGVGAPPRPDFALPRGQPRATTDTGVTFRGKPKTTEYTDIRPK